MHDVERFALPRIFYFMGIAVLIAEDEALLRLAAVSFMEDAGFVVHEASDADEAVALLEAHKDICVLFSDIHMPGSMDGLKLAHYVWGRWPLVKLIITSGLAHPRTEEMPAGCGFIGKPYRLADVAHSLRAIVA